MRFYKYLIYRLYTWRLQKKDDTPEATVIFLMSFVHLTQLGILYMLALKFVPALNNLYLNKLSKYLIVIGFGFLYYLLVYNKKRWLSYIEEFEKETSDQRRKGTILVRLFTFGSVILFFICLPLLFWPKA